MANVKVDIIGEISEWYNSMPYLKYKIDEANGASIDFTISSGGGSVTEGMGMADLISTYSNETTATGIGLVASIATVVLLAADKVKMTENSFLMIHRPWSQAFGNSDELEATADLLDKMEEKLIDIYSSAVYKRKGEEKDLRKKIKKMMAAETWMTSQEALEFGFIDEIVKTDEKNIDLLPLQNSLSKFINVPAALLINNKKNDDMGNSILEKIKSLLNQTEILDVIEAPAAVDSKVEEVVITDEMAIDILKAKGYTVLNAEEITALSEKSNEQSTSITEIETVLETLGNELVALRAQVKKGVGLPSGGTTAEKIIETKAKLSPFDSFAGLVKNKISQR